ncbi:MAG: DUF305 domain-containing protein [Candidatus Eisenbacteria bacterium]|nr:DUF305 domain-containing protein [Candidatus Eisenbacteria bacterium]
MKSHRMDTIFAVLLPALILCIPACIKPKDKAARSPAKVSPIPPPAPTADQNRANADETPSTDSPYELQYIDTMIRHHRDALEAGQLAATRAQHAELREGAAKLVSSQQRQITLLRAWRDRWYAGKANAENLHLAGMTRLDKAALASLSNEAFDRKFIDLMIPHHQCCIVMAKEAFGKVEHSELKALSQQIMDVQQQEIDRLNGYRAAWGGGR